MKKTLRKILAGMLMLSLIISVFPAAAFSGEIDPQKLFEDTAPADQEEETIREEVTIREEETIRGEETIQGEETTNVLGTAAETSGAAKRTIMMYIVGSDLETEAGLATYNLKQILNSHFSDDGDIRFIVMTGGSYIWQLDDNTVKDDENGFLVFPDGVNVPEDAVVTNDPYEPFEYIPVQYYKSQISGVYNQIWEARSANSLDEQGNPDPNAGKLVLLDGDGITGADGVAVKGKDELMSDPEVLKTFVNYCADNYPAEKYDLILWDHGGGPRGGFGSDEHYEWGEHDKKYSIMSFADIVDALSDNKVVDSNMDGTADGRFDFVDFDACLMSSVELALVMADYTDYYIASAETEPGYGQYYGPRDDRYTGWLDELGDPAKDDLYNSEGGTFELGKVIVDDFYNFYEKDKGDGWSQDGTLSVFDTRKMISSGTGFIDALLALCNTMELQAKDPDMGKGVLFYDELKSFYHSIEYGDSELFDLGDVAALLAVVNCEVSPKNIEDGEYVNVNDYYGISMSINRLLQLQDTDPEKAFMYQRGTSGIWMKDNYYRKTNGEIEYGGLGSSGMSIFFPASVNGSSAVKYFQEIDRVIELMPENDKRTRFLREYEKVVALFSLILYSGTTVNNLINDDTDNIEITDKNEVDYQMVLDRMQHKWYGSWDYLVEPCRSKVVEFSEDKWDQWTRTIIKQQIEDAVETTKVTVEKENDEEGAACAVILNHAKKRVVESVERSIIAELPAMESYLATIDVSKQQMLSNYADLSLGAIKGKLRGMPENASAEEMIQWYNESGATWDVEAMERKWYAINDAGGNIHVASVYLEDQDGYYIPALYGSGADGEDEERLVMLEFSPEPTEGEQHALTSIYFMHSDMGPVQIMAEDLVQELTIMPILYIRTMFYNYYAPISQSAFTVSADNAASIRLEYMDVDYIEDIADTDGDGRVLDSSITITDIYGNSLTVTDRIPIRKVSVRPAVYTGEELVPEIYYLGETLREYVDYVWYKNEYYDPDKGTYVAQDFIEPGTYNINIFGKGRFQGMFYDAVFTIAEDEATAQTLIISQAKADLERAQSDLRSAIELGSHQLLNNAYENIVKAQNALARAQEQLQKIQDEISKEEQQRLRDEIKDLEDKIQDLSDQLAEARVIDISNFAVTLEKTSYEYTGKAIKPAVKVSGLSKKDYTVSYSNNIKTGMAKVTIKAKGDRYTGKIVKNFKIKPAANAITKVNSSYSKTLAYGTKAQKVLLFSPKAKESPKFTYKITSMKKGSKTIKSGFTISRTGVLKAAKKLGKGSYTVKVKISAAATANYKAANKTVTIKVRIK